MAGTASGTLESYRLPVAPDIPDVEVILLEHPDAEGPFGAKGVAEPPIVPVAAAIANAIADATGGDINELPISMEAVLDALLAATPMPAATSDSGARAQPAASRPAEGSRGS